MRINSTSWPVAQIESETVKDAYKAQKLDYREHTSMNYIEALFWESCHP